MTDMILTARSIITMDPKDPRATAVAVSEGEIRAVGDLDACRGALPDAPVTDLGATVLMPGFVEPHSHLVGSGMATMPPAVYVAPWLYATWDDIAAEGRRLAATGPEGDAILMFGLDNLLHARPMPTAVEMDAVFGNRVAGIMNLSGHGISVTTATITGLGWDVNPPADPHGGHFERNPDGSFNGIAMEPPAWAPGVDPI